MQDSADGPFTMHYNKYEANSKVGKPSTLEVDVVVGGDGANSRVAREIDAGEYDFAIAFQVSPWHMDTSIPLHLTCCHP